MRNGLKVGCLILAVLIPATAAQAGEGKAKACAKQTKAATTRPAVKPSDYVKGKEILTRMFETYKQARTFQAKGALTMTSYREQRKFTREFPLELYVKRPDKIFMKYPMGWTISNGTKAVEYYPDQKRYREGPAPKKLSLRLFSAAMLVQPLEAEGLMSEKSPAELVQRFGVVKYDGSEELHGQMMDIIRYRQGTMKAKAWIGRKDHLVHKVQFTAERSKTARAPKKKGAAPFDKTEGVLLYEKVQAGMPLADEIFTFKPPEGVKKMALPKRPRTRPTRRPSAQPARPKPAPPTPPPLPSTPPTTQPAK